MVEPPGTFDDLVESRPWGFADRPALATVASTGGFAERSLVVGLELTDRLWTIAADHRRGIVGLPVADIDRFASDLATTPPGMTPASRPLRRLVHFEVERAHGLLDASYTLVGALPRRHRFRLSWEVGSARSRLQAMARRPDAFAVPPKSWKVSRAIATFRTLRRAHHRRRAAHPVG